MPVRETKPIWTSATFLVYTGGLTVLLGGAAALAYLSATYGSGPKRRSTFSISERRYRR